MNSTELFYMGPGELNPDASEVWGVPRHSTYAACWLVDWFDSDGACVGASTPTVDQYAFINKHPEHVSAMQRDCETWLKRLGMPIPIWKRKK